MAEPDAQRKRRDALIAAILLAWQSGDWSTANGDAQRAFAAIAAATGKSFGVANLDADPAWRQFMANVRHYLDLHGDLSGDARAQYVRLVVAAEMQGATLALARDGARRSGTKRIRRITHPEATISGVCPICKAIEGEHDADSPEAVYFHPNCACTVEPVASVGMAARDRMTTSELATFRDYSADERKAYASRGIALSDGSFPIPDRAALRDAIHRIGTTKHAKSTVIAHIRKRAKALGAEDELGPETGGEDKEGDDKAKNAIGSPEGQLQLAGFTATGNVMLSGKVFEVGDFPDKGFSLSEEEADAVAASFLGAPIDLGHPEVASPLDGNLGSWTGFRRDGSDIYGTAEVPPFIREAAGDGPIRVSVAWDRASKLPVALSFVQDPRISDAALMAAFARHDTYSGQAAMQEAHDTAVRHGAVCKRPAANMASRHESDANQAIHDLAADHGARCDGAAGGGWAMYSREPAEAGATQSTSGKGKHMDWKNFWGGLLGAAEEQGGADAGIAAVVTPATPAAATAAAPVAFAADPRVVQLEADLARERMTRSEGEAISLAEGEITAERSTPAERDGMIALYRQLFEDDLKLGLVKFGDNVQTSRTALFKAFLGARDRRLMTKELMATFSPEVLRNAMQTVEAGKPKPMDESEYRRLMAMTSVGETVLHNSK